MELLFLIVVRGIFFIGIAIGIAGLVGAVQVLVTRADAFSAADRMPKAAWAGILFAAGIICVFPIMGLEILKFVGVIMIGLYWFDVRPQLRNILDGNAGWS